MRHLMWAGFAAGLMWAGSGASGADDTVRLGGPSAQADIQGNNDIDLVRGGGGGHGGGHGGGGHGGGFGHGGYGHGGGFGHGGYGHGGYGRGYGYGGYGRGYGYGGYGRGYGYGGYGWGGYGWGGGYGVGYYPYYAYSPYYYQPYPYYYNYPLAGGSAPTMTLQTQANYGQPMPGQQQYAAPMPPAGNSYFPYDGGPQAPVPMPAPNGDINPAGQPRPNVPLDGKLVSLPTEASGGFAPVTTPETQRLRYVLPPTAKTPTPRVVYPAYGEQ